jgi:rhodanese-related sulfurtransferase
MSEPFPVEISPHALKQLLDAKSPLLLVDCREPQEHAFCQIPEARLIPMSAIPERTAELIEAPRLVIYCHHGIRSLHATRWLRRNGLPNAQSLAGGIEAWADEIDPEMPRY